MALLDYQKDIRKRLNFINLPSYIVPQTVPITFHGLLNLINYTWIKMESALMRERYDDDDWYSSDEENEELLWKEGSRKCMIKVMLHIAMAKLHFGQTKFQASSTVPDTQSANFYYDERQLHDLVYIKELPKPLAMYIDAIGMFSLQGQTIIPRLTKHKNAFAFNVAPSSMDAWLQHHATPVVKDEDFLYSQDRLKEFHFKWEKVGDRVRLSPSDVEFYSGFPTFDQIFRFREVLHFFTRREHESFLMPCDITTGVGSSVQAVRFLRERKYYVNRSIPDKEMSLAKYFCLGEDGGDNASPLVCNNFYLYSYKYGFYSPHDCFKFVHTLLYC